MLIAGCFTDPDLKTNLRPEGPPEVLAILALDFETGGEAATFCKYVGGVLDEKGPGLVQGTTICENKEADFVAAELPPLGWGLRVVFDELLDGDAVETLDCDEDDDGVPNDPFVCDGHIDTTNPVQIVCGATVIEYDGYYVPNGNKDSFPVGPSLVIEPNAALAAAGSNCMLTINPIVKDRSGEGVATGAQTSAFTLPVASLALVATDPADADAVPDRGVLDPDGAVAFIFNALIDGTSIAATEVVLTTGAGVVVASGFEAADNAILIYGAADLVPGDYVAKITTGASFDDVNGGSITFAAEEAVRFVVAAP